MDHLHTNPGRSLYDPDFTDEEAEAERVYVSCLVSNSVRDSQGWNSRLGILTKHLTFPNKSHFPPYRSVFVCLFSSVLLIALLQIS